ncbi:MAG TPA: hypothetical protein VFW06_05300 [Acidimicrobiia bacterium]|nr:hypothetical protein [Acidimicrobiia bacterium]
MALIEFEGVARRCEVGGGVVTALCDVDLEVARGEFVDVLGPSGVAWVQFVRE